MFQNQNIIIYICHELNFTYIFYHIHGYPETRAYGSLTSFDPGFVCNDDGMSVEMVMVKEVLQLYKGYL